MGRGPYKGPANQLSACKPGPIYEDSRRLFLSCDVYRGHILARSIYMYRDDPAQFFVPAPIRRPPCAQRKRQFFRTRRFPKTVATTNTTSAGGKPYTVAWGRGLDDRARVPNHILGSQRHLVSERSMHASSQFVSRGRGSTNHYDGMIHLKGYTPT